MKKIVTIGGGTGTYTLLTGLKTYPVDLTAIVAMSDDGGSSGRLRTKLGVLPPGDVRQALIALSQDEELMLDMLKYRFNAGELRGHNLGNLILSGLSKITGDFQTAVNAMSTLFHVKGRVIPVTTELTQLKVRVNTGQMVIGETIIDDEPPEDLKNSVVQEVLLEPAAKITEDARKSIIEADAIIIGPGDFWGSIVMNLVVDGMREALAESKAKVVYVSNLMTRWGQKDFPVSTYLSWIERFTAVDYVIINNGTLPEEIVNLYAFDNEYPVLDDVSDTDKQHIIRENVLGDVTYSQDTADEIKRSLLRHDPVKLADIIINQIVNA